VRGVRRWGGQPVCRTLADNLFLESMVTHKCGALDYDISERVQDGWLDGLDGVEDGATVSLSKSSVGLCGA
jgi:hypothetical protein